MSYAVSDAVWKLERVSPTVRLVLLAIALRFFDDELEATLSVDQLVALTGYSDRAVQKAILEAEKLRLLQVVRTGGRARNKFRVLFEVPGLAKKEGWKKAPTPNDVHPSTPNDVHPYPEPGSPLPRTTFGVNPEPGSPPVNVVQRNVPSETPPPEMNPERRSGLEDEEHYQSKAAIWAGSTGPTAAGPKVIPSEQEVLSVGLTIDPKMDLAWIENWYLHALDRAMRSHAGWQRCLRSNWLQDLQAGRGFPNRTKKTGSHPMAKHNGGQQQVKPKFV